MVNINVPYHISRISESIATFSYWRILHNKYFNGGSKSIFIPFDVACAVHQIDIVDVASSAWWMKISGEKLFFVLRKLNIGLAHQMVGDDNIWRQSYAGEPSTAIIMQWRHSNTRHLHSADTASVWAWYSHSASTWMYPDCLYPSR